MERSMSWKFEKFKGDMAIYAICPYCDFSHNVRSFNLDQGIKVTNQYNFCPICGHYLYVKDDYIDVIWEQRTISESYKEMVSDEK